MNQGRIAGEFIQSGVLGFEEEKFIWMINNRNQVEAHSFTKTPSEAQVRIFSSLKIPGELKDVFWLEFLSLQSELLSLNNPIMLHCNGIKIWQNRLFSRYADQIRFCPWQLMLKRVGGIEIQVVQFILPL